MPPETSFQSDRKMRVALEKIDNDKFDVRDEIDEDHVDQIAESLEEDGQWNPIIIRPNGDGYDLIAGHTRFRAAQELEWDDLEATVKDVDDERANELALKTNLKRKGMSKIEEGRVINDLLQEHELTEKELAEKIGKSRRWVSERVRVALELDPAVKGLVQEGELSYNIARIVTQVDEDQQHDFAEYLIDRDVTQAEVASREKKRFQNDTIYTVGYEGLDFDEFVELLKNADVEILLDVRKSGASNYKPEFNTDVLDDRLDEHGIEYRHLPELGVESLIRAPYKDGYLDDNCFEEWYTWWVKQESGVDLEKAVSEWNEEGAPALMCIESSPTPDGQQSIYCHRHFLSKMVQNIDRDGHTMFPTKVDL